MLCMHGERESSFKSQQIIHATKLTIFRYLVRKYLMSKFLQFHLSNIPTRSTVSSDDNCPAIKFYNLFWIWNFEFANYAILNFHIYSPGNFPVSWNHLQQSKRSCQNETITRCECKRGKSFTTYIFSTITQNYSLIN